MRYRADGNWQECEQLILPIGKKVLNVVTEQVNIITTTLWVKILKLQMQACAQMDSYNHLTLVLPPFQNIRCFLVYRVTTFASNHTLKDDYIHAWQWWAKTSYILKRREYNLVPCSSSISCSPRMHSYVPQVLHHQLTLLLAAISGNKNIIEKSLLTRIQNCRSITIYLTYYEQTRRDNIAEY
jgi:hypothetical protein